MSFICPIQPPTDGFTKMEQTFLKQLVVQMYRIIKNPEDKFIMLAHYELGYPQEVIADMLGKSQVMVSTRIKKIVVYLRSTKLREALR